MSSCEKCWVDAYRESYGTSEFQGDVYSRLIEERKDDQCSLKEQAGQYWDEEKQMDTRNEGVMNDKSEINPEMKNRPNLCNSCSFGGGSCVEAKGFKSMYACVKYKGSKN